MSTPSVLLSLNSSVGKQILAHVRGGNYAHPGEAKAIDLVMGHLLPNSSRRILDVGCGLGGSANDLQMRGLGGIVGIDIDEDSISIAKRDYPNVEFHCADAGDLGCLEACCFNVIVLFTAFYAFSEQDRALREMARVAKQGAELLLFDYTAKVTDFEDRIGAFSSRQCNDWNPVRPETIEASLRCNGWDMDRFRDLSAEFEAWYVDLVRRIDQSNDELLELYGPAWVEHLKVTYGEILSFIRQGILGGALVYAHRSQCL